jgi:hypothetical protein
MLGMRSAPFSLMVAPKFAYGRISLILLGFASISGETEFLD